MAASDDTDISSDQESGLAHPGACTHLFGHEAAEATLAAAYRSGAMPTSWLIGGPKGVGKATLAYRFARWLLSGDPLPPNSATLDMPSNLSVARMVAAQAHPGLLVLKRPFDDKGEKLRKNITIDEVRKINAHFGLSGQTRGYRVCIVDAADELSEEAANALLKTLEEPPSRSVFLLLAHAPMRLLPTIRSRSRRITLKPLGIEAVAQILAQQAPDLSIADRNLIAALCEGIPGRALTLARSDGLSVYRDVLRLVGTLPHLDVNHLHDVATRLSALKAEQHYRVAKELFAGIMRRLVLATHNVSTGTDVPGEEPALRKMSAATSLERWIDVWDKITALEARADTLSLDRKQVVLSKFTALSRVASGADSGL